MGNNDKTPPRLRFNVLSIDYVRVINCFYDYDYDYDYDMKHLYKYVKLSVCMYLFVCLFVCLLRINSAPLRPHTHTR